MNAQLMRWFTMMMSAWAASLVFASGFGVFENGMSPMGAAGAYVARAEDGSALFINPAGLAHLDRREIAFSLKFAFQGSHYSNVGQTIWGSDQKVDALPHFVFHDKVGRFAYGVGTTTSYFYDLDWNAAEDYPGRFLSTGSTFEGQEWSAGGAFEVTERISLGASLRYIQNQYDISRRLPREIDDGLGGTLIYEVDERVHGDGDAVGFTLAGQYYKSRWFSMGFTYQSGTKVDLDGNRTFALATRETDARAMEAFAAGFAESNMQTQIWLPQRICMGVATKVTVRTRLEIDVTWDDWSDWKSSVFTFGPDGSAGVWEISRDMGDVFGLKVAGDFQHRKNLLWSMGLAMRRGVVDSADVEPSFPDADCFTYAGGVSYLVEQWIFQVAYVYQQYRDTTVVGQEFIVSTEHPDLIVSTGQRGLFETQRHHISLGVRRRF